MVTSRQTALAGADFDTWLSTLQVRWSPAQIEIVRHAYALGGEPELAVADLLTDLRVDHEVVAAALLHEPVATGQTKLALVEEEFGPAVARLVDGIAKLDAIGELHQSGQHAGQQLESLRKMLLAMAQDVRVVLIKLAMRLHELRQLGSAVCRRTTAHRQGNAGHLLAAGQPAWHRPHQVGDGRPGAALPGTAGL